MRVSHRFDLPGVTNVACGTHIKVLILLPAVALAGLTAACGAGGNGSGGAPATSGSSAAAAPVPAAAKDDRLAALVPAAVAADGKVTVGQDQTYPPNEFVDEGGK